MSRILSILLILTVAISCGNKKDKNDNVFSLGTIDLIDALSSQEIECESENCPKSVVRLLRVNSKGEVNTCSGFKVGEKLIATNAHCVDEKVVLNGGDSCEGVYAVSQTNEYGYTNFSKCLKLVASKLNQSNLQDYAFLEMETDFDIPIREFDFSGASHKEELETWVVHQISLTQARVEKKSCTAYENMFHYLTNIGKDFPIVTLKCKQPIISGNSGSMVLNKNDKVVSILSHSSSEKDTLALSTSVSCINTNALQKGPKHCDKSLKQLEDISEKAIAKSYFHKLKLNDFISTELGHSFLFYETLNSTDELENKLVRDLSVNDEKLWDVIVPSCYKKDFKLSEFNRRDSIYLPVVESKDSLEEIVKADYLSAKDHDFIYKQNVELDVSAFYHGTALHLTYTYKNESVKNIIYSCK